MSGEIITRIITDSKSGRSRTITYKDFRILTDIHGSAFEVFSGMVQRQEKDPKAKEEVQAFARKYMKCTGSMILDEENSDICKGME